MPSRSPVFRWVTLRCPLASTARPIERASQCGSRASRVADGRARGGRVGWLDRGRAPYPLTYAITTQQRPRFAHRAHVAATEEAWTRSRCGLRSTWSRTGYPVTRANKINVMDPISALVMPAPRPDKPLDPAGCERKLAVFDGVARFDVALSYARTGTVTFPGYTGPALMCSARYTPIAGPSDLAEIDELHGRQPRHGGHARSARRLARCLLPVKIAVRTLFGMLEIDATSVEASGERIRHRSRAHAQTRAAK